MLHLKITNTSCYCQILIKFEFWPQIFEKSSNIKFHENPSSGSSVFPFGQTDGRQTDGRQRDGRQTEGRQTDGRQTDRQTDRQTEGQTGMTKLIVAFHNFSNDLNEPKNKNICQ
jgi:hypothetical protein